MNCSNCGTENEPGRKFCKECGSALVIVCDASRGRWIDAVRRTAESGLAALEGRREDALAGYERALGEWRALDTPLDQAFCAADMAHVVADEELTTEALAESTPFLKGIGAVSLLERIESARPSPAHAEVTGS